MFEDDEQIGVAEDRQDYLLVDILSGEERKRTEKEEIVQRMIEVLAAEYHYPLESMGRDVSVPIVVDGRRRIDQQTGRVPKRGRTRVGDMPNGSL